MIEMKERNLWKMILNSDIKSKFQDFGMLLYHEIFAGIFFSYICSVL